MDADFWLTRWCEGRTGFHQARVTPLLPRHWPELDVSAGSRVLVPLCGKSLDMLWLAEQGLDVLGVELSPLAVQQFFAENNLPARQQAAAPLPHWQTTHHGQTIDILCGDIFALDALPDSATQAACSAVLDRAALVALPVALRKPYVDHVYGRLMQGAKKKGEQGTKEKGTKAPWRGLLFTLEYEPAQTASPPFSVNNAEVHTLFHPHARATLRQEQDILAQEPKALERGLTSMQTRVYQLHGS